MSLEKEKNGTKSFKEKSIPRIKVLEDSWIDLRKRIDQLKQVLVTKVSPESIKVSAWTVLISAILTYVPYISELDTIFTAKKSELVIDKRLLAISIFYIIAIIVSLIVALLFRIKSNAEEKLVKTSIDEVINICNKIEEESGYKAHKEKEAEKKTAIP